MVLEKKIQNIKAQIPKVENSDFRIFQFESLYFYSYINKEGRVYEDMRGNIILPEMMCNRLLTLINVIKQAGEKGDILYL